MASSTHPEYDEDKVLGENRQEVPRLKAVFNAAFTVSDTSADYKMTKTDVVLSYWKQSQKKDVSSLKRKTLSVEEIQHYIDEVLHTWEVETKELVNEEVTFITTQFKQRRCKNFCLVHQKSGFRSRTLGALRKLGIFIGTNVEYCECGNKKTSHTHLALENPVKSWGMRNTELVPTYNFGSMDIPGHFNYLDSPTGTRKYIRLDDLATDPKHVWKLLTHHWKLKPPNLVISITGGDVTDMKKRVKLHSAFRHGLLKAAVTTNAWVITEGLCSGASKEVGDIFQEDLRKTEWAERRDHANIPLIAIVPWGILADRRPLYGIHVGTDETRYLYKARNSDSSESDHVPNALDPHHTVYLFTDDGTNGQYNRESVLRGNLEEYVKKRTTLRTLGGADVKTPLILLVVGGDKFTLQKVKTATSAEVGTSVVIVNDSGPIADVMAEVFKALESQYSRHMKAPYTWTEVEETFFNDYIQVNSEKLQVLIKSKEDEMLLKECMKARHLIEVFGTLDGDVPDLDKAILQAIFGGLSGITVQLTLTLAMDRCDVAEETIFIESRKSELRQHRDILEGTLYLALKKNRSDFVRLLLDQDYGGELEFYQFLTVQRLHQLHEGNMRERNIMGKLLRSMCKRDRALNHVCEDSELLPQIGRVISKLLGGHYRLLYQQKEFREGLYFDRALPHLMANNKEEEAVWHLLIWAVLSNQRQVVELFIFETSCKLGAALLAFTLFSRLSKQAEKLSENELAIDLQENALYFENVASSTLTELYEMNRDVAYGCLVSVLPFHLGRYLTPLSLAHDAQAMRFMGHSSCQTFLLLVWNKYMDVDTAVWKLFPLFSLFPFLNLPFIVFDKRNLSYGVYQQADRSRDNPSLQRARMYSNVRKVDVEPSQSPDPRVSSSDADYDIIMAQMSNYSHPTQHQSKLAYAWFALYNYYTSPITKFSLNLVSYVIFLGLFTSFVLTHLAPITLRSEITIYEHLVYLWVVAITAEEIRQLLNQKTSGPLENLNWIEFEPDWKQTWHWYERLKLVLRLYPVSTWLADYWNRYDGLMLLLCLTSVTLRHTLSPVNFGVARIFYTLTIMAFYFRILRFGYILQNIGPRIITIAALIRDLIFFLAILSVFIISFGISFQAMLEPNAVSSFELAQNILYRPYWQILGDLFLDDVSDGMGLTITNRSCVPLSEAALYPDVEQCIEWMPPVMLAIFMLITNILLLNLLIAIFSHSFDTIQAEAVTLWRFHLYGLVHEYYHMSWLPYPFNLLCHVIEILIWLLRWPRRLAYLLAAKKIRTRLEEEERTNALQRKTSFSAALAEEKGLSVPLEARLEDELKGHRFYWFFYDNRRMAEQITSHFRQEEFYRDEDLEEKAFKRYLRTCGHGRDVLGKKLDDHNSRLQNIASELQELKQLSATGQGVRDTRGNQPTLVVPTTSQPTKSSSPNAADISPKEWASMKKDVTELNKRMKSMDNNIAKILDGIQRLNSNTNENPS